MNYYVSVNRDSTLLINKSNEILILKKVSSPSVVVSVPVKILYGYKRCFKPIDGRHLKESPLKYYSL